MFAAKYLSVLLDLYVFFSHHIVPPRQVSLHEDRRQSWVCSQRAVKLLNVPHGYPLRSRWPLASSVVWASSRLVTVKVMPIWAMIL